MLRSYSIETGPLFDGRAEQVIGRYLDETKREIAEEAQRLVLFRLSNVLQNPTHYYESQIQINNQVDDYVVTDGSVVYGPWLEGVGSRNAATRFKGYFTFRLAKQDVERKIPEIAQSVLLRHIGGLR